MNTRIIAVVNNKGGCGKTTTACALSSWLAKEGKSVLLVDMDGQANATSAFGIKATEGTTYDLMNGRGGQPAAVGDGKLCVLPSVRDLAAVEVELSSAADRTGRLAAALAPARGSFDYIIVDTPPSMGLLTINSLYACDAAIITAQAEPFAVRGLASIAETIAAVSANRETPIAYKVLVCMYDSRKGLHAQIVEQLKGAMPCFDARIRPNISLAEATAAGESIFDYAPRSNGAKDYAAFCAEAVSFIRQTKKSK